MIGSATKFGRTRPRTWLAALLLSFSTTSQTECHLCPVLLLQPSSFLHTDPSGRWLDLSAVFGSPCVRWKWTSSNDSVCSAGRLVRMHVRQWRPTTVQIVQPGLHIHP